MAEKKYVEITIRMEEEKIEQLKSQLRTAGNGPQSATQSVVKALEMFHSWARSVRLDEPERKEIESRAGMPTQIRNSKDILRSFERLAGGPDAITIDLDPLLAGPIRDVGRGLGYGLSEFAKLILEDSFASNHLYTTELKPLFFSKGEWDSLLLVLCCDRVRCAADLIAMIRSMKSAEEALFHSSNIAAQSAT